MKYIVPSLVLFLLSVFPSFAGKVVVSNLNDSGTGSLRWAIGAASTGDTVEISLTGIIYFNSTIIWDKSLTIIGPGPENLTLDGKDASNMFGITGGVNVIKGLAFNHGNGKRDAGCIDVPPGSSAFTTTIENCHFRNSTTEDGGGAVSCSNGRYLTMRNCIIDSCTSSTNLGGGLIAFYGAVLENCTFSNCSAPSQAGCAWIVNNVSEITNCTFYNNRSINYRGGAIDFGGNAQITMTNNTFSGNSAGTSGDAIYAAGDFGQGPSITFANNIFSSPTQNYAEGMDVTRSSNGGNVANDLSMAAFLTGANDTNNVDVMMDVDGLKDNGGSTPTVALRSGSPAIDNGINSLAPAADQRGYLRNGTADAGAYEYMGINAVKNTDVQDRLLLYPNPSAGKVFMSIPGYSGMQMTEVYDLNGKLVLRAENPEFINLSASPEGVYFVRIGFEHNVIFKKLIISRLGD